MAKAEFQNAARDQSSLLAPLETRPAMAGAPHAPMVNSAT